MKELYNYSELSIREILELKDTLLLQIAAIAHEFTKRTGLGIHVDCSAWVSDDEQIKSDSSSYISFPQ